MTMAQNVSWVIASIIGALGSIAFLSTEVDISDPVIFGFCVLNALAIVFFLRRFVLSNIDKNGKWAPEKLTSPNK